MTSRFLSPKALLLVLLTAVTAPVLAQRALLPPPEAPRIEVAPLEATAYTPNYAPEFSWMGAAPWLVLGVWLAVTLGLSTLFTLKGRYDEA